MEHARLRPRRHPLLTLLRLVAAPLLAAKVWMGIAGTELATATGGQTGAAVCAP